MDTTKQFQKILDWMKQTSRNVSSTKKELVDRIKSVKSQIEGVESRLTERLDAHSGALQALLKGMQNLRLEQHNNKIRFDKEIEKIKLEIRQRSP